MLRFAEREVEILRETIGLEEAFLQARAAFEYPILREIFVPIDAGEQLAENIILLHDMRRERRLLGYREDFALGDHGVSSRAQRSGMQSRHLVTTSDPS